MAKGSVDEDLMAEVLAASQPTVPACSIKLALADMDERTAATFVALMDRSDVTHTAIARAMAARGFHAAAQTVGRHRKGDCTCGR